MSEARNTNDRTRLEEIVKLQEIKKEVAKVNSLFKDMDPKIKKAIQSVIENAAFMAVTLRELREHLNRNGLTVEYQNGEFQSGIKKSPEIEIYNTMIKNFVSTMKSITDLLPKEIANKIKDDGFEQFVNSR